MKQKLDKIKLPPKEKKPLQQQMQAGMQQSDPDDNDLYYLLE